MSTNQEIAWTKFQDRYNYLHDKLDELPADIYQYNQDDIVKVDYIATQAMNLIDQMFRYQHHYRNRCN